MTATSLSPTDDLVSITVAGTSSTAALTVAGEVDSSSAPVLRTAVDQALARGVRELVVDLDAVTFLDSAGLCVLAAAHRSASLQGVRLRVLASGSAVIRPLQITGLWELLAVELVQPGAGAA
ncbi:STAS domain-containing protein [Geodermatophilus sp. CPCC 206100]|uniref:STAS domain-containing protein n=1 Tax=Geodermatophilus sp. CPCC 206100 TaxID=3020054 RepID=UPI003AFFCCE7